jgi:hypothetical protein
MDNLAGIAQIIRAIAWPGVVLFLALRYRAEVGRLIDRLRKGGPAEFDPIQTPQHSPEPALPPSASEPERIDAAIYASQSDILTHLKAVPAGETADRLRELFYAPALERFPEVLKSYPFENYLGFLVNTLMVRLEGLRLVLTNVGADYLLWRVETKKPPRLA